MYLLDTNICIYAMKRRPVRVVERLAAIEADRIGLSSITAAELAFGAIKNGRSEARRVVEAFLAEFEVFPWDEHAIWRYAELRLHLERRGVRIGDRDLLIASHALTLGRVVVTNDTREFERVPGLRLENWAQ